MSKNNTRGGKPAKPPRIEVVIGGPQGSGKSILAALIRKVAKENNFNVRTLEIQTGETR